MEKDGAVLLGIELDPPQTGADLFGHRLGSVGLDNAAIVAQQIEHEQVRHAGAVGNTPALEPGYASVTELLPEFIEKARLSDTGLANAGRRQICARAA